MPDPENLSFLAAYEVCPLCSAEEIDLAYDYEFEPLYVKLFAVCDVCSAQWTSSYKFDQTIITDRSEGM